ncbi:MarR family winged helix-turn-helix transcriptional regulator [Lederbergia wuyishanensis]|uniref:DNA-binding MarR family transcriptional regulator n=1 Tax=Lederbergia wuyishanensis TaxID=1347903 RepID=A0ABU0D8C2_9BACI|nr:MarR family transcriptional regulator [Lederbergia wuyishanensis]MCJ8009262.1 MarR family transcriptional regulator [Lederbergia wuyishanensis]MDQ0344605.1 DNA-binding MarR family transcriptional regulator [Lederbergia wuyishanensis]
MEKTDIFKLIRAVEMVTNETIIQWTKSFKHNIGISPILVLAELKQNGPQKQTVLAEKLGYTPGAMTNISGKLVKLGFAVREYNEGDRRNVMLSITEKGITVLNDAQQKGEELRVKLFQALSEEELQQYLAIQEKLLRNFKS